MLVVRDTPWISGKLMACTDDDLKFRFVIFEDKGRRRCDVATTGTRDERSYKHLWESFAIDPVRGDGWYDAMLRRAMERGMRRLQGEFRDKPVVEAHVA